MRWRQHLPRFVSLISLNISKFRQQCSHSGDRMEGNYVTVVAAVFVTVCRIESESFTAEARRRVMPFKPGHAEDDIVSGGSDIEAEELGRAAGMNEKGIIMGDGVGSRLSVGEDESYRMAFWKTWKMVGLGQLVINETTLSSTVYQSSSRHLIRPIRGCK